jgi:predicted tellurium resistance membrane protein TerC
MLLAGPIANFVDEHPTVKVLALAFLIMVGLALVADGWGTHIPKGYLYTAMAFSVGVEMINLRLRKLLDRRKSK